MNKINWTLIFILFTSFKFREPDYCKIADHIVKSYVQEFAKPRGLLLSGYGGAMMNDIKEITLSFTSFEHLNVDEARSLYIEMMEKLLININSNEKIRPYLHNFPFELKNVNLTIDFANQQGRILDDGHVALLFIGRNQQLLYRGYHSDTEEFYSLHREPYEEARKIAKDH